MKDKPMRLTPACVIAITAIILTASASPVRAQTASIKNGDVYLTGQGGTKRLTADGHNAGLVVSRDHQLFAYVKTGTAFAADESETKNDLYLCGIREGSCVVAVEGRMDDDTAKNLTTIRDPVFSLQAGDAADGKLAGSLFFLSDAGGANTLTVHRVSFGGKTLQEARDLPAPFVVYANFLAVVPSGKFAGALDIEHQTYTDHGACGQRMIFDPNTQKILEKTGGLDC